MEKYKGSTKNREGFDKSTLSFYQAYFTIHCLERKKIGEKKKGFA